MSYFTKFARLCSHTLIALSLIGLPILVNAQWNPQPNWKDSYAVGGKCYCDSNGYDHGLDTKTADTPIGVQNVVDICEKIEEVLGEGPTQGRIPYNDIQCGNGPANDAADEAGCPGRVDIGPAGCDQIGPKWDLAAAYGVTDPDPDPNPEPDPNPGLNGSLDRTNWVISASHNNNQVNNMVDGSLSSRWSTGQKQTAGQWITIDLAKSTSFNRIVLNSTESPNDYPGNYSVFVSNNGTNWGTAIKTANGSSAITTIRLTAQSKRYIRIEQNSQSQNYWWSIHELNIYNDESTDQPSESSEAHNWLGGIISTLLMKDE